MNDKITLPTLISLLSVKSGDTKKDSEDFIKEFFGFVSELIVAGEQVKIKDIGVFKSVPVEARKSVNVSTGEEYLIPGHRKVVFIPAKELAAEVNSPFEMFETVEISDDFDSSDLEADQTKIAQYTIDNSDNTDLDVIEESSSANSIETDSPQSINETTEVETSEESTGPIYEIPADEKDTPCDGEDTPCDGEDTPCDGEEPSIDISTERPGLDNDISNEIGGGKESPQVLGDIEETEKVISDESLEPTIIVKPKRNYHFLYGLTSGILLSAGFIAIYALVNGNHIFSRGAAEAPVATKDTVVVEEIIRDTTSPVSTQNAIATETTEEKVNEVPTLPSDQKQIKEPVYDTITTSRYLTTMAKDHYGNYHLWPYIYMENSSFLGHPDRIRPGTRVLIPDLSKYGVNPNNPKDIEIAKRKGVEIYSRYKH